MNSGMNVIQGKIHFLNMHSHFRVLFWISIVLGDIGNKSMQTKVTRVKDIAN